MKRYALAWAVASTGWMACGDDGEPASTDVTAADGADTTQADGVSGPVAIDTFTTNYQRITRGRDSRDRMVDGSATLAWRTSGATGIEILVDGVPIALDACVAADGENCAAEGSLVVKPANATTFTLRATGACEGPCPEATVAVEVVPPARVRLDDTTQLFQPGTDVALAYTIEHAASFQLGLVTNDAEGRPVLVPCADEDAPCTIDHRADDTPPGGTLALDGVERGFTVGVTATNGADDGLGDINLGDISWPFQVPVVVRSFSATPAAFLPGDEVVLAWDVGGAQTVSVATEATWFTGLSTCVGLGTDGRGFCTLTASASAPLGPVSFFLYGMQDTGVTGEAMASIDIIGGPRIGEFAVERSEVARGQAFEVMWRAWAATDVTLTGPAGVFGGLEDCRELAADGSGRCTVTVLNGAALGAATLTLTASHPDVGPAATAQVPMMIAPAPTVSFAGFDDPTLQSGDVAMLTWRLENAEALSIRENSGSFSQELLDVCTATVEAGDGGCEIAIPATLPPGEHLFELTALGPTGARSAPVVAELRVGLAPMPELMVTPDLLPEGGGTVTLAWTAATATRIVITDSASPPNTIVDTGVGTTCPGNAPCDPEADAFAVAAVQPDTWTLRAENAFGVGVASAAVLLEGAPRITALTLGGANAFDGSVLIGSATSTLSWNVEAIDAGDLVRLERAPSPGPDVACSQVSANAWQAVATFPRDGQASGSAEVGGLDQTATCFRFTAEDTDTAPAQRDLLIFKAYRAPDTTALALSDATVQPGDRVTLSWTTRFAYGVSVAVTPVGAVASQELAACQTAQGGCSVGIQAGVPLGDVVFTLVARGENGATAAPRTASLTVGTGARLVAFGANPGSVSAATRVTLGWTTERGTLLVIRDGASEVFRTTDAGVIANGTHVIDGVAMTRTWVLTVENSFGGAMGEATTFVGPSIDALTVNGGNALDGAETVITGPVTIAWATTSADGSHRLESGPVPGDGNCAAAGIVWETAYFKATDPANSASHQEAAVVANRCWRLTVTNAQNPPQTSTKTFLVREVPEITSMTTSPGTLADDGGTVIVAMGVRGAVNLALTAQYRNGAGEILGTRNVCTQATLNAGRLTGGTGVDQVECAHRVVPCNVLCINNGMPSGTTTIRYVLNVSDAENDAASRTSSNGAGDVRID